MFIFLSSPYVRAGSVGRVKEWGLPPALCLELDPVAAAAVNLRETRQPTMS